MIRQGLAVLVGCAALWSVGAAWAAAAQDAPNAAQVDLEQGGECPGPQPTQLPGLALSLETFGNPVLVSVTLNYRGNALSAFLMRPVIDGIFSTEDQVNRSLNTVGHRDIVSLTRLYWLPEGLHTLRSRAVAARVSSSSLRGG
jgi:hypothetical protein